MKNTEQSVQPAPSLDAPRRPRSLLGSRRASRVSPTSRFPNSLKILPLSWTRCPYPAVLLDQAWIARFISFSTTRTIHSWRSGTPDQKFRTSTPSTTIETLFWVTSEYRTYPAIDGLQSGLGHVAVYRGAVAASDGRVWSE